MQPDFQLLDLLAKFAQIVVAIVVGCIAWLARKDARRNSISTLLKIVADQRKEYTDNYVGHLTEVWTPNSNFARMPKELKTTFLKQLEDVHKAKRGLDVAYESLVAEADNAWGFDQAFKLQMAGMNQNIDGDFSKILKELREKHAIDTTTT